MITDKDFVDYQNLVQQRFEAMEAQMLGLMDTVQKQAVLVNQLVDNNNVLVDCSVDASKQTCKTGLDALSELSHINKEDNV